MTTIPPVADDEAMRIARVLSDTAKAGVREGCCIMGSNQCVCGSTEKAALVELEIADRPEHIDAGWLLNDLGHRVQAALQSEASDGQ